jgi:hypothetical protein
VPEKFAAVNCWVAPIGTVAEAGLTDGGLVTTGGVLEPPPQPKVPIRIMALNRKPAILAMAITSSVKLATREDKASIKFYAARGPVRQGSGTSVTLDAESLPDVTGFSKHLYLQLLQIRCREQCAPKGCM